MMISTKGRYALRVMIELANAGEDNLLPLKDIATNQNISEKYLESIIKLLVQGEMVIGHRGKGGGYKLSKPVPEYTVGSILKLAEGSLAPVACLGDKEHACDRASGCLTLPLWTELYKLIDDYFEGVTLEDLVNQVKDVDYNEFEL